MRTYKKLAIVAAAAATFTSGSSAIAADIDIPANAAVIRPVSLTVVQNLQFGWVYSGVASTVIVAPVASPTQPAGSTVAAVANTGTRALSASNTKRVLKGHSTIAAQDTPEACNGTMACQAGILQVDGGVSEVIATITFGTPGTVSGAALSSGEYGVAVSAATGTAPSVGTFTTVPAASALTLNASGTGALHVGGRLTMGSAVGAGGWQVNVPITVDY